MTKKAQNGFDDQKLGWPKKHNTDAMTKNTQTDMLSTVFVIVVYTLAQ